MDLAVLDKIKRLTLIALVSDDELMDRLVLKGGNAIDLVHGPNLRSSLDIDFSLDRDLPNPDVQESKRLFERLLKETFSEHGYRVFDVTLSFQPPKISSDMESFWGGYRLEFKLIQREEWEELGGDIDRIRRRAAEVGPRHRRKFRVDLSRHEYCDGKVQEEIDGYSFYVYTPAMLVCEKLRAICQQMPEYLEIVKSASRTPRARDFYDIYSLMQEHDVGLDCEKHRSLLFEMFCIKQVPTELLAKIPEHREYHSQGFMAVKDSLKANTEIRDFDFYFDFVTEEAARLHAFWKEQPPSG